MLRSLLLLCAAPRRTVCFVLALLLSLSGVHALAQPYWFGYEPSLGTLPDEQCWDRVQNGTQPVPVLIDETLQIGTTTTGGTQYWSRTFNEQIDFTSVAVMEVKLEVITSNYNSTSGGSGQRTGFYFSMSDNLGRRFMVGIAANKLVLTTNDPSPVGPSNPSIDFDTTGEARIYRLEVDASGGRLYVDGVFKLSTPFGTQRSVANRVYFGDSSIYGTSKALVHSARVTVRNKPCYSDFNRDCFLDFLDFDDFVEAFQAGLPIADFNGDGFLDFQDFDEFVTAFEMGC